MSQMLLVLLGGGCLLAVALALLLLNNRGTSVTGSGTTHTTTASTTTAGWKGGPLLATLMSDSMRIVIEKGMGAGNPKPGGRTFKGAPFPISSGGVVVSFEIMFDAGYEWSCGGKIGGLFVGTGSASGCDYSTNGASNRINFGRNGGMKSYVYIPEGSAGKQPSELSSPPNCGQKVFEDDFANSFTPGKWYTVHCGIRLNTVGKSDGKLLVGLNDKVRVLNGVLWRLSNLPITRFSFNPFHGGGCLASRQSSLNLRNVRAYRWD